ncbi:hypothetical protein QJS66_10535 [Kocuria rhizophila]|nr:hypothetical protein QJS66_10535 [Kocuria rhizophila]
MLKRNPDCWAEPPYVDEVHLLNFDDRTPWSTRCSPRRLDMVASCRSPWWTWSTRPRLHTVLSKTGNWLPFTMRVDITFDDPPSGSGRRSGWRWTASRWWSRCSRRRHRGQRHVTPCRPGIHLPQRTRTSRRPGSCSRTPAPGRAGGGSSSPRPSSPAPAEAAQASCSRPRRRGSPSRCAAWTAPRSSATVPAVPLLPCFCTPATSSRSTAQDRGQKPVHADRLGGPRSSRSSTKARATMDEKRNQLIAKAQKQLHDEGGYIAWGCFNQADACQNFVGGGFAHRIGMPVCGPHAPPVDRPGKEVMASPPMILKRLAVSVFVLLAVSLLVFAFTLHAPGDPRGRSWGSRPPGAAGRAARAAAAQRPLVHPLPTRGSAGCSWVTSAPSAATGGSVNELLASKVSASMVLMVIAAVIAIPVGLLLGTWSAMREGRASDRRSPASPWCCAALPEFVIGVILTTLLSTTVFTLLPSVTMAAGDAGVGGYPLQLVLPSLTLVLVVVPA